MKILDQIVFRVPLHPKLGNIIETGFDEALYLSSPVLFKELEKLKSSANKLSDKEIEKLEISKYKYSNRAANRCTPFALFAGVGMSEFSNETNKIELADNIKNSLTRKTRLDTYVACQLARYLEKIEAIRPHLKYSKNSSIYRIGNTYRYIEYQTKKKIRVYKLSRVDFSEYLQLLLDSLSNPRTYDELVLLLEERDIDVNEARSFIDELIDSQILTSQFEPNVIGKEFLNEIVENCTKIYTKNPADELHRIIVLLNRVQQQMMRIDDNITNSIEAYRCIQSDLQQILPEVQETNLFQVDSFRHTMPGSGVPMEIKSKLERCLSFLRRICPPSQNVNLESFVQRFRERFDEKEVPLLFALDKETGVGYPEKDSSGINELVNDLIFVPPTQNDNIKWTNLQSCLMKLAIDATKSGTRVVQVTEKDFSSVNYSFLNDSPSLSILFSVVDAKQNTISFKHASGSSAVNLLGRFTVGEKRLLPLIDRVISHEQDVLGDIILAEIGHLPEDRSGNVICRERFRKFEIPYLARSTSEEQFKVLTEDLTLSIRNNKIVLWSKRLDKQIIPRLGNAHNYSARSLPVYHFLCDLQNHYVDRRGLFFGWGQVGSFFSFLPRIEFEGSILSPAIWNIPAWEIKKLNKKDLSREERVLVFHDIIKRYEMPSKFVVAEGDNELVIDINNPLSVLAFLDVVSDRVQIEIQEYLFKNDSDLVVDTLGGSYANEFVATILNSKINKPKNVALINTIEGQRYYPIGSEWFYIKVYCGIKTADNILSEEIHQVLSMLTSKQLIKKWFFIRYSDPDFHLRIRFHLCHPDTLAQVSAALNAAFENLVKDNIIYRYQVDTYVRELERYGPEGIENAEQLFYFDSEFVLATLCELDVETGGSIRWLVALRSVDEYLNNFNMSLNEKYRLIRDLSEQFFLEHGGAKHLKVSLDKKYRAFRKEIENLFDSSTDQEKEYAIILSYLSKRTERIQPISNKILDLKKMNQLTVPLDNLLASLLHMNLDRIFMGRNRTNEMVIYNLLERFYKSSIAKDTKAKKTIDSIV